MKMKRKNSFKGYDENEAMEHGLRESIILHGLRICIDSNRNQHKTHHHDGFVWSYQTLDGFVAQYPEFSKSQIRLTLKRLIEKGLVKTGNFNKHGYDRTIWYTVPFYENAILDSSNKEQSKELTTVPSKPKATRKKKQSEYTNDSNYMEVVEAYPRRSSSQGLSKGQAYPLYLHWLKTYSHDEILNSVNNYRIGLENENKIGGTYIKDIKTFFSKKENWINEFKKEVKPNANRKGQSYWEQIGIADTNESNEVFGHDVWGNPSQEDVSTGNEITLDKSDYDVNP